METQLLNSLSSPEIASVLKVAPWVLLLLLVWSMFWKGLALWKAARLSSKKWFIALLIINTFGILEIIYVFFIAKKYTVEVQNENQQ